MVCIYYSPLINIDKFIEEMKKNISKFTMKDKKAGNPKCNLNIFNEKSQSNLRKVCENINKYFRQNIYGYKHHPNLYKISYMLTTAFTESYHYLPPVQLFSEVPEGGGRSYFNKYDIEFNPKKAKELGNIYKGDGYKFRGRGLVQLTGRTNYHNMGEIIKKDLETQPDLACDFQYSVPIMIIGMEEGLFTNKKLSDFIGSKNVDYFNARTIINGHDTAKLLADNAKEFEKILAQTSPNLPKNF